MTEIENGVSLKYSDVAPIVSKYVSFADLPVKAVQEPRVVKLITKENVGAVIASDENPSKLAIQVGLSKGQVMKIRKEYEAAIRHKSYGGAE